MKIVYIKDQEIDLAKPRKVRKPTAKQLQDERGRRWVLKQKLRDYNRFCKEHADRIAEIKKQDPNWELPRPTMSDT